MKVAPTRVMEVTTLFLKTPNQVSVLFEIKCSHTSASSAPQKWSTVCSTLVGELDLNYNRLTYWYFMYMHVQFQAYILKVWSVMGILTNIAKKVPSAGAKKWDIILQLDHISSSDLHFWQSIILIYLFVCLCTLTPPMIVT